MLRETKRDLTFGEAKPPVTDPACLRAQAVHSLQTAMLAMFDYAVALEFYAAAPKTAIHEIKHLSQSIDMVSERLAALAGPSLETAPDSGEAANKTPSPIFPSARPVKMLGESQGEQSLTEILRQMSPREIAVLKQLVMGLPNKLIAFELGISVVTVKAHIGAILRKMNVHSRNRVIAMLANVDIGSMRAGATN